MGGDVSVEVLCANALDATVFDYLRATVVFLYLVPRGLRLIKDVVWPVGEEVSPDGLKSSESKARASAPADGRRPQRIVTYMAPFENMPFVRKVCCQVEHQEEAA